MGSYVTGSAGTELPGLLAQGCGIPEDLGRGEWSLERPGLGDGKDLRRGRMP